MKCDSPEALMRLQSLLVDIYESEDSSAVLLAYDGQKEKFTIYGLKADQEEVMHLLFQAISGLGKCIEERSGDDGRKLN
jgi:hypothetical protein